MTAKMIMKYQPFGFEIDGTGVPVKDIAHYEASVKWTLDLISRSQTGHALLDAIRGTGKRLTIRPWLDAAVNADATPEDTTAATAAGELRLNNQNKPVQGGWWDLYEPIVGTGQGSNVTVRFLPWMFGFGGSGAASAPPTSAGAGPSAVLFHELCHAYRDMRGTRYLGATMGGRVFYNNEDEFFAILLTNIFVSDPSTQVQVRTLRADHAGFAPLAANRSTSSGFLSDSANTRLMVRQFVSEPMLANALRAVKTGFNPIRQHFGALP
jgi:hypothetical protein